MRVVDVSWMLLGVVLGAGCSQSVEQPVPPRLPRQGDALPRLLSQTGVFLELGTLTPNPVLIPYEVNVSFWSDGAEKRRWLALPPGQSIHFAPTGDWGFPSGTLFVKHFELSGRRIETRLLVAGPSGEVRGGSYKWYGDQTDAELVTESNRASIKRSTSSGVHEQLWFYPGRDDCPKCHVPLVGGVLGVNTRQLNRAGSDKGENQLLALSRRGFFDHPLQLEEIARLHKLPQLDQHAIPVEERARAFLDANCGYCHRPGGAAADFDARYETPLAKQSLLNAPARINLGIDQARQIAPKDPWRSMILVRLGTLEGTRMPPLGHEQINQEGVDLLREWISSLPGPPVVGPPRIEPKGGDFRQPASVTLAHPDPAVEIRYTLDGSPPGSTSLLWNGGLRLTNSSTVRARAFKPGHTRSIVVQDTFIIGD